MGTGEYYRPIHRVVGGWIERDGGRAGIIQYANRSCHQGQTHNRVCKIKGSEDHVGRGR